MLLESLYLSRYIRGPAFETRCCEALRILFEPSTTLISLLHEHQHRQQHRRSFKEKREK